MKRQKRRELFYKDIDMKSIGLELMSLVEEQKIEAYNTEDQLIMPEDK